MSEFHANVSLEEIKRACRVQFVSDRNGKQLPLDIEQIAERIRSLAFGLDEQHVNVEALVKKVVVGMSEGISTTQLDNLAAETCAYMNIVHPEYSILAARIAISNLHKNLHRVTGGKFSGTVKRLYEYRDKGRSASLIDKNVFDMYLKATAAESREHSALVSAQNANASRSSVARNGSALVPARDADANTTEEAAR